MSPLELSIPFTLFWLAVLRLFRGHIVFFWFVAIPGVILHELAHWFVAFLTYGQPGFVSLIPKRVNGGYALGRVPIHNPRWFNAGLIGLAPLLLIPLAYFVLHYGLPSRLRWASGWQMLATPWIAAECLLECLPSRMDLQITLKSVFPAILLAGFLYGCYAQHLL